MSENGFPIHQLHEISVEMRSPKLKIPKNPALKLKPSPTLRNYVELIASSVPGPILDVPCGYGRNALCFAELGFDVHCVDIDAQALDFISNLSVLQRPRGALIVLNEDLSTVPESLRLMRFAAILNVHFVAPDLVHWWKECLLPGGFLYIETFDNRGENYKQLPRANQIQKILGDEFELLLNEQRQAGPGGVDAVTLKLLAKKRA